MENVGSTLRDFFRIAFFGLRLAFAATFLRAGALALVLAFAAVLRLDADAFFWTAFFWTAFFWTAFFLTGFFLTCFFFAFDFVAISSVYHRRARG